MDFTTPCVHSRFFNPKNEQCRIASLPYNEKIDHALWLAKQKKKEMSVMPLRPLV